MILSEQKPFEEILGYLGGEKSVFILGCNGCAQSSGSGGPVQVEAMKQKLEEAGKKVTGTKVIDFLCEKALVKSGLRGKVDQVAAADSILVMTCGIGVQATAAVVNRLVHPAANTINVGGTRGEWRGSERCRECGDCVLDLTGGICPLTACTKWLINGPCGGAKNGKCEVEPDVRDCGWHLIYERLKKLGRLDKMQTMPVLKNYGKMQPPKHLRSTIMWALEQQETKV